MTRAGTLPRPSSNEIPATATKGKNPGREDFGLIKLNPAATSGDQVVVYSSYFGGTLIDTVTAMTIDSNGWIYLTGSTTSTDLVITDRAFQTANAGTTDGFVAVFDTSHSSRPILLFA